MPIYEYRCLECGTVFEKIVSLHIKSVNCQSCQSERVEKLFSAFAVQVHGSPSFDSVPGPCNTCGAPRQGMCRETN
ncbi:MAG: zinc ribbon domain-containing protein [Acidobacteria bacterium]|nr:MAG: zinc ribbon domain-containing protein [Acidobacteriota bacterium]